MNKGTKLALVCVICAAGGAIGGAALGALFALVGL